MNVQSFRMPAPLIGLLLCGLLLADTATAQARVLASTIADDAQYQALSSATLPAVDVMLHVWAARDTGLGLAPLEREIYGVLQAVSDPDLRTPAIRITEMGGIGSSLYNADAPAAAAIADRFIVAWVGSEPGVNGRRIYTRTINAGSGAFGQVRRISEQATSPAGALEDRRPVIACRPQNTCLVVWERPQVRGDLSTAELMGRHINSDGLPIGAEFQVSAMGGAQGPDRYATLADLTHLTVPDRYVVAWEGKRAEADAQVHVYVSRISGTSTSASATLRATSSTASQTMAAVQSIADGSRFLFGWRPNLGNELRIAAWDSTPAPVGGGQISETPQPAGQRLVRAADGAMLLHAKTGFSDSTLRVRPLDADGRALGDYISLLAAADLPEGFRLVGQHELHASSATRMRAISLITREQAEPGRYRLISIERDLNPTEFSFADGFE